MSVAICRSSTFPLPLEKEGFGSILMPTSFTSSNSNNTMIIKKEAAREEEKPPEQQLDIWSSIQSRKAKQEPKVDEPYIHPLVRRSSNHLNQKSLKICTESLGSETGSDDYFSSEDDMDYLFSKYSNKQQIVLQQQKQEEEEYADDDDNDDDEESDQEMKRKKELVNVNYHCSIGRRAPARSFPPPLPSISRRDGPCLQMRPHRKDGRLVVQAVTVPSQNYLHAERQGGRLLLSFINTTTTTTHRKILDTDTDTDTVVSEMVVEEEEEEVAADEEEEEEEEITEMEDQEEEEEEVEVVDRGTIVEVKVSTQPQQQTGGASVMKVHRSSIVINKFVSFMLPHENDKKDHHHYHHHNHHQPEEDNDNYPITTTAGTTTKRTTTTAAAAAVAASSFSAFPADGNHGNFVDNKLLFTSKRRNREELLRNMRRCSQLRKPLFIWEPCCIATSS